MKMLGGINMIITGKQFRTRCRNNTFDGDVFPRGSVERAVPTGWETADTHETVYGFSFKDSDRIVINNSLLRAAGWKKEGEI